MEPNLTQTAVALPAQNGLPFTYLSMNAVREATGLGTATTVYDWIAKGKFPAPDKVGTRSLWKSTTIAAWLIEQSERAESMRAENAERARAKALRVSGARKVA